MSEGDALRMVLGVMVAGMLGVMLVALNRGAEPDIHATDMPAEAELVEMMERAATENGIPVASATTGGDTDPVLRYYPDEPKQRTPPAREIEGFDPFKTPTLSDIDLDRLADAVATLDETVDCPPTVAPDSLDDVAEIVRIADGCLIVEYEPLRGRTVAEVREALSVDPSVLAVGVPPRDITLDSMPQSAPAVVTTVTQAGTHGGPADTDS